MPTEFFRNSSAQNCSNPYFMEKTTTFIETWDYYLILASYFFLAAAVLIVLYHEIKIMTTSNLKDRYDYVNLHEIRYFWYAIIALIGAAAMSFTALVTPKFPVDNSLKIYVSVPFLAGFVVILYMILSSVVRILYPRFLEARLERIRNKPRVSSAGNQMRKLSAEEGAVHLEAGQAAQHASEIHSVEYDVWLDDKTGEKKVEKYMAYQHSEKCGECGFYTLRVNTEEIVKSPTQSEDGLLIKHYKCSYCNHREAREVVIAKLSANN
jgi:hypothetical protein